MPELPEPDREVDRGSAIAITRRDAIQRVAALMGGVALVGGDRVLAIVQDDRARTAATAGGVGEFTPADVAFLDEVADIILPETSTPGAKAARTGAFMALMVTEAYGDDDRKVFRDGTKQLDEACRRMNGAGFEEASPAQRLALLETLDREQKAHTGAPAHYFRMMKELALLGYFTSEIGCRQAQRYVESPGRFDPCVPYRAGEKAWAPHA
jgi:Gluconate 2-dehydrogenase subunit 3